MNHQEAIARAGMHAAPEGGLRPSQRFQGGVTDTHVAHVMYLVETGVEIHLNRARRWNGPRGLMLGSALTFSAAVTEMIRTGLLRFWADRSGDHLIPAPVHLIGDDLRSACHFVGETMGPMRSRLTADRSLVDCRGCVEITREDSRAL